MTVDLFDRIHAVLGGKKRRGKYHCDCPVCGKDNEHFAYSPEGWAVCLVCGYKGNLHQLAEHLRLDTPGYTPPVVRRPEPRPKPLARWRQNPDGLLAQYRAHPFRLEWWQSYKPLSAATIDRFDLGVGRLPFRRDNGSWYLSRSEWLTVPLYEDGQLVGLRGRNLGDTGPKWISATGSQYTLAYVDRVQAGSVCWLVENYIDAALLMQANSEWSACAIGGATTWQPGWAERLAARRPELVIVALDRDLPGQATGAFRRKLEAEWRRTHPNAAPPQANGPKIANSLMRAGLRATLFRWPDWAPEKCDIGWLLMNERKVAA